MMILLKIIILNVIWILGLKVATSEGMVLHFIARYAESKESLIWEPVILCEWCMPSLHSVIAYVFAIGIGIISSFSWKLVWIYPLVVLSSSVACGVIWKLMDLINVVYSFYKNQGESAYLDVKDRKKKYNEKYRA